MKVGVSGPTRSFFSGKSKTRFQTTVLGKSFVPISAFRMGEAVQVIGFVSKEEAFGNLP